VIESQRKAKRKITWRRQVSDPLGKGNSSTHPRQNYAQAESANHQSKTRKTTKSSPCTHASSPWTNATPPRRMHANHLTKTEQLHQLSSDKSDRSTPLVRPVLNMWIGPALRPVRPMTSTGQIGDTQSPEMARNHLKTLQMHSVDQNMLKLLPLVDYSLIKPKIQKMQPRASQIDKIQHRMLHMSK
jgi:hypothetical protein